MKLTKNNSLLWLLPALLMLASCTTVEGLVRETRKNYLGKTMESVEQDFGSDYAAARFFPSGIETRQYRLVEFTFDKAGIVTNVEYVDNWPDPNRTYDDLEEW